MHAMQCHAGAWYPFAGRYRNTLLPYNKPQNPAVVVVPTRTACPPPPPPFWYMPLKQQQPGPAIAPRHHLQE